MTPANLPPLVLIHVDGGIAEEWYTVEGTGLPAVHILDFDRGDESDADTADFVAHARGILDLFKARGVDTTDLAADLDDLDPATARQCQYGCEPDHAPDNYLHV